MMAQFRESHAVCGSASARLHGRSPPPGGATGGHARDRGRYYRPLSGSLTSRGCTGSGSQAARALAHSVPPSCRSRPGTAGAARRRPIARPAARTRRGSWRPRPRRLGQCRKLWRSSWKEILIWRARRRDDEQRRGHRCHGISLTRPSYPAARPSGICLLTLRKSAADVPAADGQAVE